MFHNPTFFLNNVSTSLPFILEINSNITNLNSTSNNQFKLPLLFDGSYNFIVDWGDNTKDRVTIHNQPEVTHTYSTPGVYMIQIYGTCIGWRFENNGDCEKILEIKQWGTDFYLTTYEFGGYFYGCRNMIITATDIPDLRFTTTLSNCFRDCTLLNSSNISNWNTSNINNMNGMFLGATNFNQDLSSWDTSNVITMEGMFLGATNFNQDLSSWDVSNVKTMLGLFTNSGFNNGDITGIGSNPLNNWNTSKVETMSQMFRNCPFNQSIDSWDTSKVTDMYAMFFFNSYFDKPIGSWNTSSVKDMSSMFRNCRFNQNINSWNTSNVKDISTMFLSNTNFNQPLNNWDVSNVVNMASVFQGSISFNQPLNNWNVSNVTNMSGMFFGATTFNQNIGDWNTSKVTNLRRMFYGAISFNNGNTTNIASNPLKWITTNVIDIQELFYNCNNFNQRISYDSINNYWNTSNVTTMNSLFVNCFVFNNGQVTTINNVSPLLSTYLNTTRTLTCPGATFLVDLVIGDNILLITNIANYITSVQTILDNQNIILTTSLGVNITIGNIYNIQRPNTIPSNPLNWNTENVTNMSNMFLSCRLFNQDISNFNLIKNNSIVNMFQNCLSFNNGDVIGNSLNPLNWNIELITSLVNLFSSARSFNQLINSWNTINVTNASGVFFRAFLFNQPLNNWNVSNVTNMNNMFSGATNFNQDISNWNTGNVTDMANMFSGTSNISTTTKFNNGQSGVQSIPNITPSTCSYLNSTRVLTCPGATLLTTLTTNDVLIIQTSSLLYSSGIQSITNNTSLVLTTPYGSNISSGLITSIQRQVPGTLSLNWNTSKVINMNGMFQNCVFFNQNIGFWDTQSVTNLTNMFSGISTSLITLFNNGQIITGTTAPMGIPSGWTFNTLPTSTNYRLNSRLTTSNKPSTLP